MKWIIYRIVFGILSYGGLWGWAYFYHCLPNDWFGQWYSFPVLMTNMVYTVFVIIGTIWASSKGEMK